MVKVKRAGKGKDGGADGGAVRRAVTGAVEALSGAVEAATGRFRALIGMTSGSRRALSGRAQEVYRLAPDMIRAVRGSLDPSEVDEIVQSLVDVELKGDPEHSFARDVEKRRWIVRAAVRDYIKEKDRVRDVLSRAHLEHVERYSPIPSWMSPELKLQDDEVHAVIQYALRHMSPQRRAVYCEVAFGGLTRRETAARLGLSESTVDYHMSKAYEMMKEVAYAYLEGRQPIFTKMGRPRKMQPTGGISV